MNFLQRFVQEGHERHRKKGTIIPRSDSVGSGSGRKFLAPTLSDPAGRVEKSESRNNVSVKKKSIRASGIVFIRSFDDRAKFVYILYRKLEQSGEHGYQQQRARAQFYLQQQQTRAGIQQSGDAQNQ